MTYILASQSPRRLEICRMAGIEVQVIAAPDDAEPEIDRSMSPEQAAMAVARAKAEAVFADHPDRVVIGADTSVWIDGAVLGKPVDAAHAARMLRMLSGRTHRVITAVWVCSPRRADGFADAADVTFYPLDEREIADYIATGEPMDKAGAYGAQGLGMRLVQSIHGDFYTVMGLSGARLWRFLQEFYER